MATKDKVGDFLNKYGAFLAIVVILGMGAVGTWEVANTLSITSFAGAEDRADFNVTADCDELRGVSSIENAAQELGAQRYYELTTDTNLAEIDGVVYSCQ